MPAQSEIVGTDGQQNKNRLQRLRTGEVQVYGPLNCSSSFCKCAETILGLDRAVKVFSVHGIAPSVKHVQHFLSRCALRKRSMELQAIQGGGDQDRDRHLQVATMGDKDPI